MAYQPSEQGVSHGGMAQALGKERREPGAGRWGARRAWVPKAKACSSSSRLPGLSRAKREEGSVGGAAGAGRDEANGDGHTRAATNGATAGAGE